MPKETMTPRERWLAVLNGEMPDRLPMDYWATGEAGGLAVAGVLSRQKTAVEAQRAEARRQQGRALIEAARG